MPIALIDHTEDPAGKLWDAAGDLDDIEVFNGKVLVGLYTRGDENGVVKTKGGVYLTDATTKEDKYQSKVGMILKIGNGAFVNRNTGWFIDQKMEVGDWVFFRPNNGFPLTLVHEYRGEKVELLCRLLDDVAIDGRATSTMGPDRIY